MNRKKLFVTKIDSNLISLIDEADQEYSLPVNLLSDISVGENLILTLARENEPVINENELAKAVLNEVLKD